MRITKLRRPPPSPVYHSARFARRFCFFAISSRFLPPPPPPPHYGTLPQTQRWRYTCKNTGSGHLNASFLVVVATLCRHTVNDPINARGIFLILGVQAGAFNIKEAFILITVTSSTKLICFRQKYQKSFKIGEYSLHPQSILIEQD